MHIVTRVVRILAYARVGSISRAQPLIGHVPALSQLAKAAAKSSPDGAAPAQLPTTVRAQLALLSKQWPAAEALLLAQGQVDEAITAYQQAHRWALESTSLAVFSSMSFVWITWSFMQGCFQPGVARKKVLNVAAGPRWNCIPAVGAWNRSFCA